MELTLYLLFLILLFTVLFTCNVGSGRKLIGYEIGILNLPSQGFLSLDGSFVFVDCSLRLQLVYRHLYNLYMVHSDHNNE